jgi:tetratricopeptide (TPR) repeat protein
VANEQMSVVVESAANIGDEGEGCVICLDTNPPPIQSGCACRGDSALAHIDCRIQAALSQQGALRLTKPWSQCRTCKQDFTGPMQMALAEAWWSRVRDDDEESPERRAAQRNLAVALLGQGKDAEAEPMLRRLHKLETRLLGAEHPLTLRSAGLLAQTVMGQNRDADAEPMLRKQHAALTRVLGAEHPDTLLTANDLACTVLRQGKYADAEMIYREVLRVQKRVLGADDTEILTTAGNLATSISKQGRYVEAEAIDREVLGVKMRVFGAVHPNTLQSTVNLSTSLSDQGKYTAAEQLLQTALASCRRILGPTHPTTLRFAPSLQILQAHILSKRPIKKASPGAARLEKMRANMRAKLLTNAPATSTAGMTRQLLAAGTRVLLQRLVAQPEHNGKRARVLSFDARTGRYAVALDDGKELSLEAECVVPMGCAAAGCASEEAGSVCGRCKAVRYCSRECQLADWKAHKLTCVAAHCDTPGMT